MHSKVDSSAIYDSQDMEATYVPISRWVDKEDKDTYIMEYYSVIRENETMAFAAT